MNYNDARLAQRDYTDGFTPLNVYCSLSTCNVLMPTGTPARIYDGATFTHIICPKTNLRNFAAHKQPDTGMRMDEGR